MLSDLFTLLQLPALVGSGWPVYELVIVFGAETGVGWGGGVRGGGGGSLGEVTDARDRG